MPLDVLIWDPLVDAATKVKLRAITTKFGDGYRQDSGDGINNKESDWSLQFKGDASRIGAIRDFLDAHGGWQVFLWTPPLGTETTWLASEYELRAHGANRYSLSVTLNYKPLPQ